MIGNDGKGGVESRARPFGGLMGPVRFQSLEKWKGAFSRHWKKLTVIFQTLEKRPGGDGSVTARGFR